MKDLSCSNYAPYSSAKYLESDPIAYNIQVKKQWIKEDQVIHHHDDIEIIYVIQGKGRLLVNGETYSLLPGSMVRLLPFHIHSIQNLNGQALQIYSCSVSLGFMLYSSITRSMEKYNIRSMQFGDIMTRFSQEEDKLIQGELEQLIYECNNEKPLHEMISMMTLMRILLLFERKIIAEIELKGKAWRNVAWEVLQYIQLNFTENMDSKSVAEKFEITTSELNRHLYFLTGENFSSNLHRTRIRYACAMMQFEQLSNIFIGNYVGYSTTAAFYRKFKEIKKVTPDEYRKKHNTLNMDLGTKDNLWKIITYIYEHYNEPISEATIAKHLYLSISNINNILKDNLGKTFSQLLTGIRIHYACSFLLATDLPAVHIGHKSGFNSIRTFNRCFKEEMGTTPTEFRRK